jgi:hypothetical protein
MIADEVLKRDEERRRRRDEGEEEDEAMEAEPSTAVTEDVKPRVVAKTRVGLIGLATDEWLMSQLRFTDSEVAEMKSMGVPPRMSESPNGAESRNQDPRLPIRRPAPNRWEHQALLFYLPWWECELATLDINWWVDIYRLHSNILRPPPIMYEIE